MSKYKVEKNKYGFYSVNPTPSNIELEEFYRDFYFQEDNQNYEKNYTSDEYKYFENESKVAEFIFHKYSRKNKNTKKFIDIGCGEGFFAEHFNKNAWDVKLLDYSDYGIKTHNKHLLSSLIVGNIYKSIENEFISNEKYDFISLKNVLEHVTNPELLLFSIKDLMKNDSILRIEVPNDYSTFQKMLIDNSYTHNTWLKIPEHLHYFSFESLSKFLTENGFKIKLAMSDFPIELFLLNKHSNYAKNKETGKEAHYSRIKANNFIFEKGIENYINFFESSAKVDFGRQVIIYCTI